MCKWLGILTLLFCSAAEAALVVADPTSHARTAEVIANGKEMIARTAEVLKEMQKVESSLTGVSSYASPVMGELKQYSKKFDQLTRSGSALSLPDGALPELDMPDDLRGAIDGIYPESFGSWQSKSQNRWLYEQRGKKATIENAEMTLARARARMTDIEKLAAKIDQAKNTKAAQDLSNRLLIEIITGLRELIVLTAQMAQGQATKDYRGVSSDGVKRVTAQPNFTATRGNLKMPWGNGCSENLVKRGLCN
jgi:hypothetical protein